jgi:hypothetical protein
MVAYPYAPPIDAGPMSASARTALAISDYLTDRIGSTP